MEKISAKKIRLAICAAGELYGGVERFVSTFAEYLHEKGGIEPVVVLFREGKLANRLRDADIDAITVLPRWKYDPMVVRRLVKLFKERRISVVHAHGYQATIWGAIAGKICGARTIKTEHGRMEPGRAFDVKKLQMHCNVLVEKLVIRCFVDHVVYVTRDLQSFHERSGSGDGSSVIYNAIRPISIGSCTDLPDIDRTAFNIGIVGRLSPVKGHRVLLSALTRLNDLRDLRLSIIGDGVLRDELEKYCREQGLSHIVRFLDFRENIYDYIGAFDVLVMPSLYEGLPYTMLEAIYCKVPIIASDVGGLGEFLEHEVDAFLAPAGDEELLAAAIRRLYERTEERKRLADNAYAKLSSRFAFRQMVQSYLNLYAGPPSQNLFSHNSEAAPQA